MTCLLCSCNKISTETQFSLTLHQYELEWYQHRRVIEIDRVVNREGRRNQKRIRPMGGGRGLVGASHWPAAGLRGYKGLDTTLDKR
jgi:hypothetical protein